jgi:hypothetical protein
MRYTFFLLQPQRIAVINIQNRKELTVDKITIDNDFLYYSNLNTN